MKKSFLKRVSVFLTMIMACLVMFVNTAQAFDRQKDDSDLTQINIYQFTMTRDNMTVLSQGDGVKRVEIPAQIQVICLQRLLLCSLPRMVLIISIISHFH